LENPREHTLETLEQKISSLFGQRYGLISQLKKCREKRIDCVREIRGLSTRISKERSDVDQVFRQLDSIVKMRREMLANIREIRGRVGEAKERMKNANINKNGETVKEISRYLKSLEWKYQTERLTKEEMREILEQIKKSELKLRNLRKSQSFKEGMGRLFSEIGTLKEKLDDINTLKQEAEAKLGMTRDQLREKSALRKQLSLEIEEVDQDVSELEEKLAFLDAQLMELKQTRRRIVDANRAAELEVARRKEAQLLDQVKKDVKERIAGGKKVAFDEWLVTFREDADKALK
jgi:uncharacterized coiled-coil DUF342 family protein